MIDEPLERKADGEIVLPVVKQRGRWNPADSFLRDVAIRFERGIAWDETSPLDASEAEAEALRKSGDEDRRNWKWVDSFRWYVKGTQKKTTTTRLKYVVRGFVGKKRRMLAYTDNFNLALRFADMAILFFWRYRLRGHNDEPPAATAFNLGNTYVWDDIRLVDDAFEHLEQIEEHLQNLGAIPEAPDHDRSNPESFTTLLRTPYKRPSQGRINIAMNRLETAVQRLYKMEERLENHERIVSARMAEITRRFDDLAGSQFDHLARRLDNLERTVAIITHNLPSNH